MKLSIKVTATARSARMNSWPRPTTFSFKISRLPARAPKVPRPNASSSNTVRAKMHKYVTLYVTPIDMSQSV